MTKEEENDYFIVTFTVPPISCDVKAGITHTVEATIRVDATAVTADPAIL